MRLKKFISNSAEFYANKLRNRGYTCRFNDLGDGSYFDVTVCGPKFDGYCRDFATPREAYNCIFVYK